MSKFLDEAGLRQLIELIRDLNSEGESELPDITPADAGKVLMVNSEGKLELVEVNLPKEPTNVIRMQQDGVDPYSGQRIVHVYRWDDTTNPLNYNDIVAIKNKNLNLPIIMKDPDEVYESGHDIVDMILLSAEYDLNNNHYRVLFYSGLLPNNVELYADNRSDPMRVYFIS